MRWKQHRNLIAALLMLDAGLRVGEVIRLQWHDIYFENKPVKTLRVRKVIAKYQHEREIPLTERLINVLHWFNFQPRLLPDWPQTQALSSAKPQGHALTTRTLERLITKASMASLGFPVHPHMLRHTYATKLMKVTDIRTVQELLGHKHVSSTQIYTHVNDEDKRKAISDLQSLISSEPIILPDGELPR